MEIMLMFNIKYFMTFMIMYPLCDVVTNYVRTVESRMYMYLM